MIISLWKLNILEHHKISNIKLLYHHICFKCIWLCYITKVMHLRTHVWLTISCKILFIYRFFIPCSKACSILKYIYRLSCKFEAVLLVNCFYLTRSNIEERMVSNLLCANIFILRKKIGHLDIKKCVSVTHTHQKFRRRI